MALVALLAAVWAYLPILDNGFVCDDFSYLQVGGAILEHPAHAIHQRPIYELYLGAVRRPLGNLVWAGLVAAFDHQPRPYYLLLLALHLLNAALVAVVARRWIGGAAVLAGALFAVAYGPRNGVCWISNLNESGLLTLGLLILELTSRRAERWVPLAATALVVAGCLIKETIAPVLLVAALVDRPRWATWRDGLRRWAPAAALGAAYLAFRLLGKSSGDYQGFGLGAHLLRSWPALVTCAFASDLFGVWVERVLRAPELLGLLTWTPTVVVVWLALRGPAALRLPAAWVLLQPVPYALLRETTAQHVPSHYLYAATAPAMMLVAGLVRQIARLPSPPAPLSRRCGRGGVTAAVRLALAALLMLLLLRWTVYGLRRIRQDEADHWAVASRTLERDFATLDQAGLAAGTTIWLVMPPDQVPGGGTWWGWEGYPLVSPTPVRLERVLEPPPPGQLAAPYAIFVYDKGQGPRLVARDDRGG